MLDLTRIGGLFGECRPNHSLPQALYNDPDVYAFDLLAVFGQSWIHAGFSIEIPNPRDYVAMSIAGSSIILTRGQDGVLRGFHNSCRHRGAQICAEGSGRRARLTCPYHQWVYDLDGKLVHAKGMQEGFDPAAHSLVPVHVEEVAGAVFVCLAAEPPAFATFRRLLEPMLKPHNLLDAKIAYQCDLVEKGNWKLVMENARECYHCAVGHPELSVTFPLDDLGESFHQPGDPRHEAFAQRLAACSLDRGGPFGPWWQTERFPLREGFKSLTVDGEFAVKKLMTDLPSDDIGSFRWAIDPHMFTHSTADQTVTFSAMPTAPNETVVTCKWLVHKDAVEGVDYEVDRMVHLWNVTNLQDRDLVELNQRGVNSQGYRPGPYNDHDEAYVKRFADWYKDTACRYIAARTGVDPLPNRLVRTEDDRLVPVEERDALAAATLAPAAAPAAKAKARRAPRRTIVPAG